jgi:hypothetical protein
VPALKVGALAGRLKVIGADADFEAEGADGVIVTDTPLIYACVMFTVVLPEFCNSTTIVSGLGLVPGINAMFAIDDCSAFPINPMVIPPIHAATTTLTATVTAMSMIDATTGLRAFAFFLNFL